MAEHLAGDPVGLWKGEDSAVRSPKDLVSQFYDEFLEGLDNAGDRDESDEETWNEFEGFEDFDPEFFDAKAATRLMRKTSKK